MKKTGKILIGLAVAAFMAMTVIQLAAAVQDKDINQEEQMCDCRTMC